LAQNNFFPDDVIKATNPAPHPCHHWVDPLRDDVIYGRPLYWNPIKILRKFQKKRHFNLFALLGQIIKTTGTNPSTNIPL